MKCNVVGHVINRLGTGAHVCVLSQQPTATGTRQRTLWKIGEKNCTVGIEVYNYIQ